VRLVVAGQERLLRGQGMFERDSELGDILRVSFPSPGDDGELLLAKNHWPGKPESGAALGCDFLIRLH